MLALVEAGDEVLIPTPCWVSYIDMVKLTGAQPVLLPRSRENNYQFTKAELEAKMTERTKMVTESVIALIVTTYSQLKFGW